MSAYIRSKVTNSNFTDVTIEAKDSNAKVRQDGTFKLPTASGANAETPVGSIRYNDVLEKIQFKTAEGWKIIDAITDGLATEDYVNNAVGAAVNGLAQVAKTGNFSDLYNKPNTLAGYGIIDDIASKFYVDSSISSLVGGAPDLLNTLNEISAALNNDPNFYNNVVTQISNKLNLTGGTLTGPLYLSGAPTADSQAATKKYVDDKTAGVTVYSTDDIPEGDNNLYYTNTRAVSAARGSLSAGVGVTYNSSTGSISIGQAVGTNNDVTFNTVTANTVTTERLEIVSTGDYTVTSATNIVLDAGMEVIVNSPLTLPSYSTATLNNLVVQPGTVIYDSSVNKLKIYTPAGWSEVTGGPSFSGSYNDLTNKPTLFSGNYNDLYNKPILFSGVYADLVGKPNLSLVAITGNYNDLSNKPILFNGDYNSLTNKPILFNGNYNSLTNKPFIPTDISELSDNFGLLAGTGGGGGGPSLWSDIRFDGGTDYTESDGVEYTNSEYILDGGNTDVKYEPGNPADWSGTPPTNVAEALDRLAALLCTLNGGVGA